MPVWSLRSAGPGSAPISATSKRSPWTLAKLKPHFEKENPVTQLMVDPESGKMRDDILNEKVLSAIIEMKIRHREDPGIPSCLGKDPERG